jgi:hypothetical protein
LSRGLSAYYDKKVNKKRMGNSCCWTSGETNEIEGPTPSSLPLSPPPDIRILAETVEPFSLKGKTFVAVCTRVIDGDTYVLKFAPIDGHEHEFLMEERVRLAGVDCPETKLQDSKNLDTLPEQLEEKKHGLACKKLVEHLIQNKLVRVEFGERSKFGYPLVHIWIGVNGKEFDPRAPCISLNEYLLQNTPSLPYNGKTKSKAFPFHKQYNPQYMQYLSTAFTTTP